MVDCNNKFKNSILEINSNSDLNNAKLKLLEDWKDYLANEWLDVVLKTEKWFNSAIRKFAVKLIQHYDKIDPTERKKLIDSLKKLID